MGIRSRGMAGVGLAPLVMLAALAGSASADLTRVEVVTGSAQALSAGTSATATCGDGRRVVGAGASIEVQGGGSAQRILLDAIRPSADLSRVTARAREDPIGTSATWSLHAHAICAAPPPGLGLVRTTSASSSAGKSVVAACPSGKRLLGTGGETNGGAGSVVLDGLLPNPALTQATAAAFEGEAGTTSAWTVTAYAICSQPVRGLARVAATSVVSSEPTRTVAASCPAGKALIGSGGTIGGPSGRIALRALSFDPLPATVTVEASEDATGVAGTWSASAFGICAAVTSLRSVVGSRGPHAFDAVWSPCPEGTDSVGFGAQVNGALGRVWLRWMRTNDDLGGTEALGGSDDAGDLNWRLTAHAICRTRAPGTTIAYATGPLDQTPLKSATATCRDGTRVLGAGGQAAETSYADQVNYDVFLQQVTPDAALRSVTVTGVWQGSGEGPAWRPSAWAICAPAPPGLERVVSTSVPDTERIAAASATCPAGKHLVGTGAEVHDPSPYAWAGLDDVQADPALTRTAVIATHHPFRQVLAGWSASAYAICIRR